MDTSTRVFVGGSRCPIDPDLHEEVLDNLLGKIDPTLRNVNLVYSADFSILDRLTLSFAKKYSIAIQPFPIRWKQEGNEAAINRNKQLFSTVDYAIIFWDGFTKEVPYMFEMIKRYKVKVKLIVFEEVDK